MDAVFFSIIIPMYNAKMYILDALESVKRQTEKDYEVILVDDGSTDDSGEIVDRFIRENRPIDMKAVKFDKNQGISSCRNAGIERAAGKYICFLDADDYWYPDKLKQMKQAIHKHKDCNVFWHWEDHIRPDSKKTVKYRPVDNSRAYMDLLYHDNCLSTSATVVETSILKSIGGFNRKIREGEDYDCWLRLAQNGAKFFLVRKTLGVYRISGNSASSNYIRYYRRVLRMLRGHYAYWMEASDHPERIRRIWGKKKVQYLCSCGRQLSVSGNRKDAYRMYRRAINCDRLYWKAYAGIILAVFDV